MATHALDHVRSDFDPFDANTRRDPYLTYQRLRGVGPVVRLTKYDIWAVPRYAEIKAVFADHTNFSNAGGSGSSITSSKRLGDPEHHPRSRSADAYAHAQGAGARPVARRDAAARRRVQAQSGHTDR